MTDDPLAHRVIAVPEARELDVFSRLLERRGATVWRCPLVDILDAPNPAAVLAWVRAFAAGACDDLILLTGEGLRRLLAAVDRHEPALRPPFLDALGRVRRITRGPKPARVLRELGLAADIAAETPTSAGVIATLSRLPLQGRRIGVQLYGSEPNRPLIEFLKSAGAQVSTVAPYVYAAASDDDAVRALLQGMSERRIDAIAFTSQAQVERLFAVSGPERAVTALAAVDVAAVGPVVADALRQRGVRVDAMPAASWSLKPLASELCELLGQPANPGASSGTRG
jgi:uroporphyrinogen-III synthase